MFAVLRTAVARFCLGGGVRGCGGGQHEAGGGLRGGEVLLERDAGVGVGGEHDAGVTELFLDGFEVGSGGVGEGRGAVPQVAQPYRWLPGFLDEVAESAGEPVGVQW